MSQTAIKILDKAQELVQKRGFNAFSYADLSKEIGIKTASIHYHFPSKIDLGVMLIDRYRRVFIEKLNEVNFDESNPVEKIRQYIKLYNDTLINDRMCLCGMMASDGATLPKKMQKSIKEFFIENEKWLAKVFKEGKGKNLFNFIGSEKQQSQAFLSGLQGALLISRVVNNENKFKKITNVLLENLVEEK